jgi:RNA polymerase sigma-70 factor (ECF subfamily)
MDRTDHEQRFRALFDEHRRLVLGYALRRVDEPADAADVVAETFLVAWRRLADVPDDDAARPWLLGVARRALANQRRGARRRDGLAERLAQELAARVPEPADDEDRVVRRALANLAESDRELLLLAGWEGLTPAEIATVTGLRGVTVRSRLHRARGRLRAELRTLGWRPAPTSTPFAKEHVA